MFRIRTLSTGVAGSPFYTNMYFAESAGLTASAARDAVLAFWSSLQSLLVNDITHSIDADVPRVNPASGVIEDYVTVNSGQVVGQNTATPLPYANQGLVNLLTNGVVRSRRVRGRIFVPGLPTTAVDVLTGTPSAATVTALNTAADGLVTATGTDLVVWSRPRTVFGVEIPGSQHLVTDATARDMFAVLRSRRD